jgi:hypothetical protein
MSIQYEALTTDQLTEAVEAVDPDWVDHFAGDLDLAVARYLKYCEEFRQALQAVAEEAT